MTSAQVVETSVNVTSNSPSQGNTHWFDDNLHTYDNYTVNSYLQKKYMIPKTHHGELDDVAGLYLWVWTIKFPDNFKALEKNINDTFANKI